MSKAANKAARLPRWASRLEAMAYGRVGSTRMNEWIKGGKVKARKDGAKVIIDLNSVDDLIESLPSAAAE